MYEGTQYSVNIFRSAEILVGPQSLITQNTTTGCNHCEYVLLLVTVGNRLSCSLLHWNSIFSVKAA